MNAVDVLIVGGGLTGCATAWHLAERGARVLLIEAGELNGGASGQNAGSLHFQIERRFLENGPALADQASRVLALNRLAIEDWRILDQQFGPAMEIVMHGGLMVAHSDAEVALLERKAAREAEFGVPTELLDATGVAKIAPYLSPDIRAAAWLADEGHANPRTITRLLAARAIESGATVRSRTRLADVSRSARGFHLTLESGEAREQIRADRVLLATGAATMATGVLFNLHLPVFPAGLTMTATERTAPMIGHLVQHVGRRLSMKQTESGNILIGGGWASKLQRGATSFDLSCPATIDPDALQANLRAAADTVPGVAALNIIRSWTGIVALTADQLPLVGAVSRAPGLYVAAGGSGFTLGPTFARLLAAEMAGERDGDSGLALFSPDRFDHLNGFMG
ncbi:glycine/D-amino acid oxidase-like deaminating enzyme [Blastomonas natatoria]|uniref:Glycine/D-amino acid oxidase-like deaminating enzyme n=1 Tax=Blastomonas natatoria TaxID=34015 RepID=A0A2V3VCJ7_9SPHN|nr:FAD-dependent oxidoreductase [Blastomonas natatoria]PXW74439.1 glycine/D-amino acid oxidase-like deaminating enzyme [Blastomonas natatoria]